MRCWQSWWSTIRKTHNCVTGFCIILSFFHRMTWKFWADRKRSNLRKICWHSDTFDFNVRCNRNWFEGAVWCNLALEWCVFMRCKIRHLIIFFLFGHVWLTPNDCYYRRNMCCRNSDSNRKNGDVFAKIHGINSANFYCVDLCGNMLGQCVACSNMLSSVQLRIIHSVCVCVCVCVAISWIPYEELWLNWVEPRIAMTIVTLSDSEANKSW